MKKQCEVIQIQYVDQISVVITGSRYNYFNTYQEAIDFFKGKFWNLTPFLGKPFNN